MHLIHVQLKPHRLIAESKADIAEATQDDYHKLMHLKPHRLITKGDVDTAEAAQLYSQKRRPHRLITESDADIAKAAQADNRSEADIAEATGRSSKAKLI